LKGANRDIRFCVQEVAMPGPKADPSPFAVHPAVAHVQAILRHLRRNTGQDLDGWVTLVKASGPEDEKGRRAWLLEKGLGGAQARLVAEQSLGRGAHGFHDTPEGYLAMAPKYVEQQYAGKKAPLRPLFEALLALARDLGPEVKISPCETLVPLYRNHVFAQIKASTLTRVDLGLALGDPATIKDPAGRLVDTGGFQKKDRLTHRLEVRSLEDLDVELKGWLKRAYELDAKS
jgi:hypothetical protein